MTTWQDEENARRATLDRVGPAIAAELEGWQYMAPIEGHRAARLVCDSTGTTLLLSIGTYGATSGRIEVSAATPDAASYAAGDTSRLDRPQITVSPDRPAATLARDIARRVIPSAVDYWTAVTDRIAARVAAENVREGVARELATVMGGRVWSRETDWRAMAPGDLLGDMIPSYAGETVHVDIRVPIELARKLAAVIGDHVGVSR